MSCCAPGTWPPCPTWPIRCRCGPGRPAGDWAGVASPSDSEGVTAAAADLRKLARTAGLSVAPTAIDGLFLTVSGTAGQLEHFFHTDLSKVRLADGTTGRRAAGPCPAAPLGGQLGDRCGRSGRSDPEGAGVAGHADRWGPSRAGPTAPATSPDSGQLAPHACAAAQADNPNGGVFTDDALAALYGADGLYQSGADGNGQTIAVYELEPFAPRTSPPSTPATSAPPRRRPCPVACMSSRSTAVNRREPGNGRGGTRHRERLRAGPRRSDRRLRSAQYHRRIARRVQPDHRRRFGLGDHHQRRTVRSSHAVG